VPHAFTRKAPPLPGVARRRLRKSRRPLSIGSSSRWRLILFLLAAERPKFLSSIHAAGLSLSLGRERALFGRLPGAALVFHHLQVIACRGHVYQAQNGRGEGWACLADAVPAIVEHRPDLAPGIGDDDVVTNVQRAVGNQDSGHNALVPIELGFDDWLRRGGEDPEAHRLVEQLLTEAPGGTRRFRVGERRSGRVLGLDVWIGAFVRP